MKARAEIPMKEWLAEEARRQGTSTLTIWKRLKLNPERYYPAIKLRRVNKRVVYVIL